MDPGKGANILFPCRLRFCVRELIENTVGDMKTIRKEIRCLLALTVLLGSGHLNGEETKASGVGFRGKDIHFKSHDGYEMFGRLALPDSQSPRAIVVYVQTAEGATVDQKRSLGREKTFNYHELYRKKFPEMGVGFFSYEGRGIRMGDSPPRYEKIDWDIYNTSTLENKARDVLSAVGVLRERDGLKQTPFF